MEENFEDGDNLQQEEWSHRISQLEAARHVAMREQQVCIATLHELHMLTSTWLLMCLRNRLCRMRIRNCKQRF